MKKIICVLFIFIGLSSCTKKDILDNIYSNYKIYIKNSLDYSIEYELVGLSDDRSEQVGYSKIGYIESNETKLVYELKNVAVAGYDVQAIKIFNTNRDLLFEIEIPYPFFEKCNVEKLNEYTQQVTLDINNDIFNTN